MDKSEEIAGLLTEIRDLLRNGARQQAETLEFLRAEAERSKLVVDKSVALQEVAVQRQKVIQAVALPGIGICMLLIAWLVVKYMM
jgi:hypothetical protein